MSEVVPVRRTSVTAVLSLIFGLVAWFALPVLGAIVAVVCGHAARAEIRRSGGWVDGDGLAIAGLVLGWLNLALVGLVVLLIFGAFGIAGGILGLAPLIHHFNDLSGCGVRV